MNLCRRLWKYLLLSALICAIVFFNIDKIRAYSTDSTAYQVQTSIEPKTIDQNTTTTGRNSVYTAQFKDQNHTYQFLSVPKSQCANYTRLHITILSTAANCDVREAIRKTWANPGNSEHLANNDVRITFIVSKPANESLNHALQKEIELHDDLIVTNLYESYELLILKVHAIMTYKQVYCPTADFQLKCDDDMAVDLDGLYRIVTDKKMSGVDGISGILWINARPIRVKKHRWYVPKSLYSSRYFPWYCNGPIYLLGREAIPRLMEEAKKFNYWILEDVFWTGVVAESLRVKHYDWTKHLLRLVIEFVPMRLKCSNGRRLIVGVHNMKGPQMIRDGYNKIMGVTCK